MSKFVQILILLAVVGCAVKKPVVQADVPAEVITVPVRVYVPIEPGLLEKCAWPRDARLRDVIEVARKRGICNEQYERQLDAIGGVQGKPVVEDE